MIDLIIAGVLMFLGLPILAVVALIFWGISHTELNRPPTKEEWKDGKRERSLY